MNSSNVIVVIDKSRPEYADYQALVFPYLKVIGLPLVTVSPDYSGEVDAALIIVGHSGIVLGENFIKAVESGVGLVCTDASALSATRIVKAQNDSQIKSSLTLNEHYITALHDKGEVITMLSPIEYSRKYALSHGEQIIPELVEVCSYGSGRIVVWHSMIWCLYKHFGRVRGMDDLFRRSIVWAAKKPFVTLGMPNFIGMRIDDVWGAWRNINPENPLMWVDIANSFGIKPWLGIFPGNINDAATRKAFELVQSGNATAFPHGYTGCEWVGSPLPEHWGYFDHRAKKPYTDEQMAFEAKRLKAWFDDNRIPISKYALAHYYEMGQNALAYLCDWGCEFIGIHMNPDEPYDPSDTKLIKCGPYRDLGEEFPVNVDQPVWHADYLAQESRLFNFVIEIRDITGYEWHPSTDVDRTVKNGIQHIKRAFLSGAPAFLFTHESCYIQRMLPAQWEAALSGTLSAVESYQPVFETADNIAKYVRARHNASLDSVSVRPNGVLDITASGSNDMEIKCRVFKQADNGEISDSWERVPPLSGKTEFSL